MQVKLEDKYLPIFFARAKQKQMSLDEYLNSIFSQLYERMQADGVEIEIESKQELSEEILKKALRKYKTQELAVAWTGGKDSTLILWLVRKLVKELKIDLPRIVFIDEGNVFDEVKKFIEVNKKKWKLQVDKVQNEDVISQVKNGDKLIKVDKLNEKNRRELKRIGFEEKYFKFEAESFVGNHLMKTVALNNYLEENGIKALVTGIRWDEQGARENETYFSPRKSKGIPLHTRVHPILHLTERDIWTLTQSHKIPYCKLYEAGYRSLGARDTTGKLSDKPAWEQDMDKIPERAGRQQDKEKTMKKLRDLGYM